MTFPVRQILGQQDQAIAREAQQLLKDVGVSLQVEGGKVVELPPTLTQVLGEVLEQLAAGQAVTILPTEQELTTQEAANLLGVSRPFFIEKILEAGKLPYHRIGKHRRIALSDLLDYQQRDQAEREAIVAAMTANAQEWDLD